MSDQASSVLDVLMYELNEIGVNIICNAFVKNFKKDGIFKIELEDRKKITGDRVDCSWGKAMPSTGSDGNGFELAKDLDTASLTFSGTCSANLKIIFQSNQGVKFVGTAEILDNNKSVAKDRGIFCLQIMAFRSAYSADQQKSRRTYMRIKKQC